MTSRLRSLLGTALPLIQAPMAGVQDSALAAAVSNAGALGSLPAAMLTPDTLRRELDALAALTSGPYNVNFFCHHLPQPDPNREAKWRDLLAAYCREFGIDTAPVEPTTARTPFDHDVADVLVQMKPPVVSFHFGLPSPELLLRLRQWRPVVMSTATTVDEAQWLEANGVDVIIAQGIEAGGHRGMFLSDALTTQVGTFSLVPQIARSVNVPVVATGGIADANGVAAAFVLGADAVQIGTAYLLCPEATTTRVHRDALASPAAVLTAVTNVFTGRPARGIMNRLIADLGPMNAAVPSFPRAAEALTRLRQEAERRGSGDFSPMWAGQNVTGCKGIPAGELTMELAGGLPG